jgi:dihydrofolate reductase
MNQIPKIVFSGSLKNADWGDRRIISGDLAKEIARLKQEPGRDLLAHGGVRFAQSLIRARSIDEYRLIIHPIVLGKGKRIFSDLATRMRFKLVNQATFKTGLIAMEMQPA